MIEVAQQHVDVTLHEIDHHLLELVLIHLTVADAGARFRHDLRQPIGDLLDAQHAVVHEKYLPASIEFAQ